MPGKRVQAYVGGFVNFNNRPSTSYGTDNEGNSHPINETTNNIGAYAIVGIEAFITPNLSLSANRYLGVENKRLPYYPIPRL